MKKIFYSVSLIYLTLFFASCQSSKNKVKESAWQSTDGKTSFQTLILPNKMKVMLVSDPRFQKASAQLSVSAGSMNEPNNKPGLAHFLEHMLFIGSKKYPEIDYFANTVQKFGGTSNAYTENENTSFYFNIPVKENDENFDKVLDIFSRFFIDPSFEKKYIDKEKNAINSEYNLDLTSLGWKYSTLLNNVLYKKDSKINRFRIGNMKTLANIPPQEVKEFYEKYYDPRLMALTIASPEPISELKNKAKKYFSAVKASEKAIKDRPYNKINDLEELDFSKFPIKVVYKAKQKVRSIDFRMFFDKKLSKESMKHMWVVSNILNSPDKNTLKDILTQKQYIEEASFSVSKNSFNIWLDLTKKGYKNYKDVFKIIFGYINFLKQTPYPEYLSKDDFALAKVDYKYPTFLSSSYYLKYSNMLILPDQMSEVKQPEEPKLELEKDKKALKEFFDNINFEKFYFGILSDDASVKEHKNLYGFDLNYSILQPDLSFFQSLNNTAPIKDAFYPPKNKYASSNFEILKPQKGETDLSEIMKNVYYQKDQDFNTPKSTISLSFTNEDLKKDDKNEDFFSTIVSSLREELKKKYASVPRSGMDFYINGTKDGFSISVSGLSEKLTSLLKDLTVDLKTLPVNPDVLKRDKSEMSDGIAKLFDSEQSIFRYISDVAYGNSFGVDDLKETLSSLSVKNLEKFRKDILPSLKISGVFYGNLTKQDAMQTVKFVKDTLGVKEGELKPKFGFLELDEGEKVALNYQNDNIKNNYTNIAYFDKSNFNAKKASTNKILGSLVNNDFFTDLRTEQQYAYSLGFFAINSFSNKYIATETYLLSEKHTPKEVHEKVTEFISKEIDKIKNISQEDFDNYKKPFLIYQKDKDIYSRANSILQSKIQYKTDDYKQFLLDNFKNLTLDDFKKYAVEILNGAKGFHVMMSIYAKDKKIEPIDGYNNLNIDDFVNFKKDKFKEEEPAQKTETKEEPAQKTETKEEPAEEAPAES